jgi:hypothetical protein
MPRMNGFELYRKMLNIDNQARVCFITAFRTYWGSLGEYVVPKTKQPSFIKKPIGGKIKAELENHAHYFLSVFKLEDQVPGNLPS